MIPRWNETRSVTEIRGIHRFVEVKQRMAKWPVAQREIREILWGDWKWKHNKPKLKGAVKGVLKKFIAACSCI